MNDLLVAVTLTATIVGYLTGGQYLKRGTVLGVISIGSAGPATNDFRDWCEEKSRAQ